MKTIKGVIFDMDGVIVDSSWYWIEILTSMIEDYGETISQKDRDEISGCSDEYELEILSRYIPKSFEELRNIRGQYIDQNPIQYHQHIKPGIKELLEYLKEHNIHIALASSSPMISINRMLEELQISQYFEHIMSGEMVRETKPHPQIYLDTVSKMNLDSDNILVVEDSTYGIESARAANLDVLVLKTPEFDIDEKIHKVFESHDDIKKYIENRIKEDHL